MKWFCSAVATQKQNIFVFVFLYKVGWRQKYFYSETKYDINLNSEII